MTDGRLSRLVFSFGKKFGQLERRFLLMPQQRRESFALSDALACFALSHDQRNKTRQGKSCYVTLLRAPVLIVLELKHVVFGLFIASVVCQVYCAVTRRCNQRSVHVKSFTNKMPEKWVSSDEKTKLNRKVKDGVGKEYKVCKNSLEEFVL